MTKNKTPLFLRPKSKFWKALLCPFLITLEHLTETFIWASFVIFAGQLGTIINIIRRSVFLDWDVSVALIPDSISGTFYTFSLVLIASLLAPLFVSYSKDERPNYQHISSVVVVLMFFVMILCAVFYSFAASDTATSMDYSNLTAADVKVDGWQLTFYIIAFIFAIYCHGFSLLKFHEDELKMSSEYFTRENDEKKKITVDSSAVKSDGKGIAL